MRFEKFSKKKEKGGSRDLSSSHTFDNDHSPSFHLISRGDSFLPKGVRMRELARKP